MHPFLQRIVDIWINHPFEVIYLIGMDIAEQISGYFPQPWSELGLISNQRPNHGFVDALKLGCHFPSWFLRLVVPGSDTSGIPCLQVRVPPPWSLDSPNSSAFGEAAPTEVHPLLVLVLGLYCQAPGEPTPDKKG